MKIFAGIAVLTLALNFFVIAENAPWPEFHGPERTNMSKETGLLKQWPEKGPELLLSIKDLGKAYGSFSFDGDAFYTAGSADKKVYVYAFGFDGKLKWKALTGESWEKSQDWQREMDGARSTPTVNGGMVYHLSDRGQLTALDARDGKEIWTLDIVKEFDVKEPPDFGYSESVIVREKKLFVYPGGQKGYAAALAGKTGKTVWANTDIGEPASYSSPVFFKDNNIEQLALQTNNYLVSCEADTGKLLWKHKFTNFRNNNCTTSIYKNGTVFTCTGYGTGGELIKLNFTDGIYKPESVWFNKALDNLHGGVILLDGCLYGSGDKNKKWFCADLATGKTFYESEDAGSGSILYADGMFYCLTFDKGELLLVKPSKEKFNIVSRFKVPSEGQGKFWAHPAIYDGKLYVRHAENIYIYRIK